MSMVCLMNFTFLCSTKISNKKKLLYKNSKYFVRYKTNTILTYFIQAKPFVWFSYHNRLQLNQNMVREVLFQFFISLTIQSGTNNSISQPRRIYNTDIYNSYNLLKMLNLKYANMPKINNMNYLNFCCEVQFVHNAIIFVT